VEREGPRRGQEQRGSEENFWRRWARRKGGELEDTATSPAKPVGAIKDQERDKPRAQKQLLLGHVEEAEVAGDVPPSLRHISRRGNKRSNASL
jgi:hypothetical protein